MAFASNKDKREELIALWPEDDRDARAVKKKVFHGLKRKKQL